MLCFGQAPGFLHGKGNFLVIRHSGLAVNWLAPLPRFFRLPDAQENIPIDPAILANHWSWAGNSLQQSVPQADNFVNSEYDVHLLALHLFYTANLTIIEVPAKRLVARMPILKQVTTHIQDHQQIHPSQHSTDPDALPVTVKKLRAEDATIRRASSQTASISINVAAQGGFLYTLFSLHVSC